MFLFTVAFIVTLIAAAFMLFSPQAERIVLQHTLQADPFFLGSVVMFMLCLNALRDSQLSPNLALFLMYVSWIPCMVVCVKIEQIQKSFNDLFEIGKKLDSKRTKNGIAEMQAVLFFIEMERIAKGQKNRVHRAILAHKRYKQAVRK